MGRQYQRVDRDGLVEAPPSNFIAGRPKAALLFCLLLVALLYIFSWIVSLLFCQFVLYVILALWPPVLKFQLSNLFFVCVLFVLIELFAVVCLVKQSRPKGEGWSTTNQFQPPPQVISLLAVSRRLFCFW